MSTFSNALVVSNEVGLSGLTVATEGQAPAIRRLPPVPWRDPHTVSPTELADYIGALQQACDDNPQSSELRTCLGMAHAMNYDVYKSMDALELAVKLDPGFFWAQLKFAELQYRIRALNRAEEETVKALNLATCGPELGVARRQLQEIRRLKREGTQKPEWKKPLRSPVFVLGAIFMVVVWTFRSL